MHTEYSLLSLLHNQENVIHHHGFFKVGRNTFFIHTFLCTAFSRDTTWWPLQALL